MHKIFDKRNVAAGGILEHIMRISPSWNRHKPIYKSAYVRILKRKFSGTVLEDIRRNNGPAAQNNDPCNRQHHVYTLHAYGGCFHRIQWRLPAGSLQSLWLAWNIGDTVNNIPPVGAMNAPDVKHLDNLPNPNNEARRPSQKTMADICFVCTYIQSKVQDHGCGQKK